MSVSELLKKDLELFINDKINRDVNRDGLFRAYINTIVKYEIAQPFLEFSGAWSNTRKRVALEQLFYHTKGIDVGKIDGLIGPQTRHARDLYLNKYSPNFRDSIQVTKEPTKLYKPSTKVNIPKESEVPSFYGEVGQNQVRAQIPYDMILDWAPRTVINSISVHRLVKDPVEYIFNKTLEYYGKERIVDMGLHRFGGSLNVRRKRGGSSWSMHAWGIAIDLYPAKNGLRTKAPTALFSRPEYEPFWQIVYDAGAISLGKEYNFDWMHFQFAR